MRYGSIWLAAALSLSLTGCALLQPNEGSSTLGVEFIP
jgi:hypothetical protein